MPSPPCRVVLIAPPDYAHAEALREVVETVHYGLLSLGHTSTTAINDFDPAARNILIGGNLMPRNWIDRVPPDTILYNLEQWNSSWIGNEVLPALMARCETWDYDAHNLTRLREAGLVRTGRHVPIGYVPELTRIPQVPETIDVLFYGSLNARRQQILVALEKAGLAVQLLFGQYGPTRDAVIARSKIVINIHFYDTKIFEIARISYLLANAKAVVTEKDPETRIDPDLSAGMAAVPYEKLIETCIELIRDTPRRQAMAREGFNRFSQRPERDILRQALDSEPPIRVQTPISLIDDGPAPLRSPTDAPLATSPVAPAPPPASVPPTPLQPDAAPPDTLTLVRQIFQSARDGTLDATLFAEACRLFEEANNPEMRAALAEAYQAGQRRFVVDHPAWHSEVVALLAARQFEPLLTRIQSEALHWMQHTPKGTALFLPQLDLLAHQAGLELLAQIGMRTPTHPTETLLYLATEVYAVGGHTRIIEDMVRTLPEFRHILILTDIDGNHATGLNPFAPLEPLFRTIGLEYRILNAATLVGKVQELGAWIAAIAPRGVFHLAHHHDAVINAALHADSAPTVLFIHHADHCPSLGASRADFIHLDHFPGCHDACLNHSGTTPILLPLSCRDNGIIPPTPPADPLIGLTCGSCMKYLGREVFSYPEMLIAFFKAGMGRLYHVGLVPEVIQWQFRQEIVQAGIDPERLIFLGEQPALHPCLQQVNPDFFLGSYPVGGGKTTIEVLSSGVPVIQPRPAAERLPLLQNDIGFGASLSLFSLDDAASLLARIRAEKATLAARSRAVFEAHYARNLFEGRLRQLLAG
ncbi:MAG: hypothetical protein H7834_10750 [Magnetococcus sp. YQC-9]